jgi:hypothetical protein
MSSWLKCLLVEPGMLPGEFAVETQTSGGGSVSLFAPAGEVRVSEHLMRVEVLGEDSGSALVRLPAPALEVGSQMIGVPISNLVAA